MVSSRQGEDIHACFEVEFTREIEDPLLTIAFRNEVRHTILVASTRPSGSRRPLRSAASAAIARFAFENRLAPSRYTFTAASVGARSTHDVLRRGRGPLRADRAGAAR